jgi:hypothetical protein
MSKFFTEWRRTLFQGLFARGVKRMLLNVHRGLAVKLEVPRAGGMVLAVWDQHEVVVRR